MKSISLLVAMFILTIVLTSCAPATPGAESPMKPTLQVTQTPVTDVPSTNEATVQASVNPEFGTVLMDGERMSLYIFLKDTQNSGASTCTAGCAEKWPPLLAQVAPVAGEEVDATLLGTITRDDGSLQVSYNGWPLYYYKVDVTPGDYYGQGLDDFGGRWWLVSSTGEAIQQ
jgi:predicted lipoprotein with Yx(FWY)xxD motif